MGRGAGGWQVWAARRGRLLAAVGLGLAWALSLHPPQDTARLASRTPVLPVAGSRVVCEPGPHAPATAPAMGGSGGDAEAASPPPPGGRRQIVIDLARRTLTLYDGGRPLRRYPVAVGKADWASPVGEWHVERKARDWGGGFGSRWLGLDVPWGIYGIHGTNKGWSVGGAESHGCFRMFNRDVEELWDMVPQGTPVTVRGPWVLPGWMGAAPVPIREGTNHQAVVYLQVMLRGAGFYHGTADGRYQASTRAAVQALERFYGLPADGVADGDVLILLGGRATF